jgi:hypothetical protein
MKNIYMSAVYIEYDVYVCGLVSSNTTATAAANNDRNNETNSICSILEIRDAHARLAKANNESVCSDQQRPHSALRSINSAQFIARLVSFLSKSKNRQLTRLGRKRASALE